MVFALLGLYNSIWSFVSTDELVRVMECYGILAVVAFVLIQVFKISMPKSFYVMGLMISALATLSLRFGWRLLRYLRQHVAGLTRSVSQENVMIIGPPGQHDRRRRR